MLQSKEGLWMSDDKWNFKSKDDFIYIENISKAKFWGTKTQTKNFNDKVILEDVAKQFWKKGKPNAEGYSTLENFKMPKIMTAISSSILRVIGNIPLR